MLTTGIEQLKSELERKSNDLEDWKQKFFKSDAESNQLHERV